MKYQPGLYTNMKRGNPSPARIEDSAARLEALGNPTRLGVFRLLVRAGDDGLPVGQLQRRLNIAPSTLSHHLRALITVDLVSQERQGTTLMCRANYKVMASLISFLADECCADVPSGSAARQAFLAEIACSPKGRKE